jgi:hypothetical protein
MLGDTIFPTCDERAGPFQKPIGHCSTCGPLIEIDGHPAIATEALMAEQPPVTFPRYNGIWRAGVARCAFA